jgi:hypothetical protein
MFSFSGDLILTCQMRFQPFEETLRRVPTAKPTGKENLIKEENPKKLCIVKVTRKRNLRQQCAV